MVLKNPNLLFKKYIEKFDECISVSRLLSENEIEKKSGVGKVLFEQHYLQKLRELALIITIPKDKYNESIIKEFKNAGKFFPKARSRFYFFTPETSRINIVFKRVIEKFEKYIENKSRLEDELSHLINQLQTYELMTTISMWNPKENRVDNKFKKDYIKEIKKVKSPNKNQKKILRRVFGDTHFVISEFLVKCFKKNPIPSQSVISLRIKIDIQTRKVLELLDQDLNLKKIIDIENTKF